MTDYTSYIQELTGYVITDEDKSLLQAITNGEEQHILNYINALTIPDGLKYVERDLVVAKFLTYKKGEVLGSDKLNVVKSLTEGDVAVQIGGTTSEERLNGLIIELNNRERDLSCYRQIKWC